MLTEYDVAAWHSTDAVMALEPPEGSVTRYVARKTAAGWVVVWGRFNEQGDRFLMVYEATQGLDPKEFKVKQHVPPLEDTDFYLYAARALGTALEGFRGEDRPYNAAVLPAPENRFYVYFVPAQTKWGVYPLGGDTRYLISADGKTILESRRLHKSILEVGESQDSRSPALGVHTHVLESVPEDTDVFHVLRKEQRVPEYIITEKYVFLIEADGEIRYVGEREKVLGQSEKKKDPPL